MEGREAYRVIKESPSWVKLVATVLLLAAVVFITYHLNSNGSGLDTTAQDEVIERSDSRTKKLNKQANRIKEKLQDLTRPERENRHQVTITKSKKDAEVKIDSIALLDFNQQSLYWSEQITRLDSIRREYEGSHNQ